MLTVIIIIIVLGVVLFFPHVLEVVPQELGIERSTQLNTQLRQFLESKESPLASETQFLLGLKHWKLLVAISAIESQYCKHQLGYNCWGIGGDNAYRHYSSFRVAAQDADDLIIHWQSKGRWLTIEDMNCHYVQPCNPNWVKVVNQVINQLNELQ